ncbi:amidohydrolase family protein [Paenibacillus beijingensis]|uniref:Amidohydrolase n=1 Tax=Paenibacillus beijingensis TaxID=1126833 RepID=A0A0D5NK82_9BACL|nr:amidohydrolase family protein [Paenibacillus beijingensis]AJY75641.1 amidohydrolase [Paenibacillus beijingensis]
MMGILKLGNVKIGHELCDIILNRKLGIIEKITSSGKGKNESCTDTLEFKDTKGLLYIPAFKDSHIHLDKNFLGEPWQPLKPFLSLEGQLKNEKSMLSTLSSSPAVRARRLLDLLLDRGTASIRTHVDVDPDIGLSYLEDILRVREEYRGRMKMEIVAFPQQGLIRSNSLSIMKEAMRAGADLVGGVDPAGLDQQVDRSLEAMFELSAEFHAGVDMHLHDPGHLGVYTIEKFADLTKQAGKAGRTAVSHAYCMGQVSEAESLDLAHKLKEADVGIITSVPIDHPMPRVDQLLNTGVQVHIGCDNILDAWSPFGNGDLLARGSRLAEKFKWRMDHELMRILPLITSGDPEPKAGDPANFILVEAMNSMHAVASVPKREAVFVNGQLVGGEWMSSNKELTNIETR